MEEKFSIDIIDGKIINWDKLNKEELNELKKKLEDKEKEILKEIDKILDEEWF